MSVSIKRCAFGLGAVAALGFAMPGTASADFNDPWPEISATAVHIQEGDGGPFFVREPGADSPDVNLLGTVEGKNISDDWRSEMCLIAYGSFDDDGTPDRETIQCNLSVRPDGTVRNLDDVSLTGWDDFDEEDLSSDDAFIAGLYLIPEEDNPMTLQNENAPLINPAEANLPVGKALKPGANGQMVGVSIYQSGTLHEQNDWQDGNLDAEAVWDALGNASGDLLPGADDILGMILGEVPSGLLGRISLPLNLSQLFQHELTAINANGMWAPKGMGGNLVVDDEALNFGGVSGLVGAGVLSGSMNLELLAGVFDGVARLDRQVGDGSGPGQGQLNIPSILVDGKKIGYSTGEQAELAQEVGNTNTFAPLDGFSPMQVVDGALGRSLDPATGDITLQSVDPIAYCADDDGDIEGEGDFDDPGPDDVDAEDAECDHLTPAGFSIERTYEIVGETAKVTDRVISTGGKAAGNVQLSYEHQVADPQGGDLDPRFGINNGSLRPVEGLEQLSNIAPNTSLIIDGEENDPDGDDDSSVGIHTFNTTPAMVYWVDEVSNTDEEAEDYVSVYNVSPSAKNAEIVQTFGQARTIQDARELQPAAPVVNPPAVPGPTNTTTTIVQSTVQRITSASTPGATAPAVVTQQSASRARTCTVPRLRGRTRLGAERALVRAGCAVGRVRTQKSKKYKKGRVVSQSRAAGRIVAAGTAVQLRVSRGRR